MPAHHWPKAPAICPTPCTGVSPRAGLDGHRGLAAASRAGAAALPAPTAPALAFREMCDDAGAPQVLRSGRLRWIERKQQSGAKTVGPESSPRCVVAGQRFARGGCGPSGSLRERRQTSRQATAAIAAPDLLFNK
jgi:hypothetical protein